MPKKLGLLGKKIGMTRIYSENGSAVAVTVIETGPCVVLQKKSVAKEGYDAIQVGFGSKKESRMNKPETGHAKASGKGGFYHIKEFRVADSGQFEVGQTILVSDLFKVGDIIDVSGAVKGRGFQGVIRRHGFKGGPSGHGSMFHRAPGSVGCSAWPSRVIKGKKMPGRMGFERVTVKNLEIVKVEEGQNLLAIKGAIPGRIGALLEIRG